MQPLILPYHGKTPKIDDAAFIAPGAVVVGDVEIGPDASVWYGCVLRGDAGAIRIGARSNVQDGTVIHMDDGGTPTLIGEDVLIGHKVMLHGCTIEDRGFVGMSATVLDGAVVKSGGLVAANAFVTPGKTVSAGELWAGSPAKMIRELREGEDKWAELGAAHYVETGKKHIAALNAAGHGA
ncbi:MAG: gamma carbonic anhydrase family protein [Pseudomonadota bacterium]